MNKKITAIAAAWLLIAPTMLLAQTSKTVAAKPCPCPCSSDTNSAYSYANARPYYANYRAGYRPDSAYRPEAMEDRRKRDSIAVAAITADMFKDGLITTDKVLNFTLSNTEFIINGEKQTDAIFERYKSKYVPIAEQRGNWSWTHTVSR